MPVIEPELFKAKAERILAAAYQGIYHLPGKLSFDLGSAFQMAEVRLHGDLATFDFNKLTVLVLAAHHECVRLEISPCNTGYLKLRFHPRLVEGSMSQRHPTIEQAIVAFEERYPYDPS